MKAENQALRLERLMEKHHVHPEYELYLPSVLVKKSLLKKLSRGDILLLGMAQMEMQLLSKDAGCAKAVLWAYADRMEIKITEISEPPEIKADSKKYKTVDIFLGRLRSRTLEVGHRVETEGVDLEDIVLYADSKKIAVARLVMVDDEIAVEVKEVKKT